MSEIESFPPEVAKEFKTYVYSLIDSRNGETFYVGKGWGFKRCSTMKHGVHQWLQLPFAFGETHKGIGWNG